ncbi:hypothetical protein ACLBOM_27355 [Escherichia coli]
MHEPMPEVFFTAFGASMLDHELRLYVRERRDRSRTVDELTGHPLSCAVKTTSTLPLTSLKCICTTRRAMR